MSNAQAIAPDGLPAQGARVIETDIPSRLDNLHWSGFHTRVVLALGITWILDGLEVTLTGSVAGALRESPALRFTAADVGLANSAYLAGAVIGALIMGVMNNGMSILGIGIDYQQIIKGLVLLAAVTVDVYNRKK